MESELIAGIASLPSPSDRSCNQLHIQRHRGAGKKEKKGKRKKRSTAKPGPISIHQGLRDNSQRHCGVTWPPIIAREMNRKFSMYKGSEMEEPNAGGFDIRSNGKYIEVRGKISRANIAGV